MGNWNEIKDELYSFETEGDSVEGVLIEIDKELSAFNDVAVIMQEDGQVIRLPLKTVLTTKFRHLKPQQKVRVTYEGEKLSKNNKNYQDFKVEVYSDQ